MEGSSDIDVYEYSPLTDETSIRLVTILPGKLGDPLQTTIEHKSLVPPDEVESTRLSIEEIRRTLPQGWAARETIEGRIIFKDRETRSTTWIHPVPDIDRALYDPIPDGKANLSVPVYEALSYAWGSPKKDETVQVMTLATEAERTSLRVRKLGITRNLADALRHLRFHDRPRTMWIDAICIDQSNTQEQSGQVRRMGRIYTLASRVVAWLGPSFPDSSLALKVLRMIGEEIELTIDLCFTPSPQCSHVDWYRPETRLPFTMNEFAAVARLCETEYMERLWVVQELQLANAKSVVVCGNEEMALPYFRRAISRLTATRQGVPQELYRVIRRADRMCRPTCYTKLAPLIYQCSDRRCTDARDKVYSLINLVNQAEREYIVVDYSKTPLDVFKQPFLTSMAHEKRLGQLRYAGLGALSISSWPTWLPNWSQHIRVTIEVDVGFQTSSISASQAMYIAPNKLEVTGLSFATVSAVTHVLNLQDGFSEMGEMLREAGLQISETSIYPNGESRIDAYIQTIAMGRVMERNPQSRPAVGELREVLTRLASGLETGELPPQVTSRLGIADKCCIFTMANGYVGLFRGRLHPGDEVFIILGCAVPMILRPRPCGGYNVVGDCYVHGVMDGEALLGALPHPWKARAHPDLNGHRMPLFRNADTGMETRFDPRLAEIPLPADWERVEFEWTPADPINCRKFRNIHTGEVINSDPRLFQEALLERGIPLRTITLI
ncbi:hypothetical protein O1611_g1808 [Lasiodiplodia mahajangana]|uniref:Uncharacterized protein n=1 Tax=Lasiodiplodia mahajangana TaxID=1108764 RepID=A0ACC2JWZ4_9PEZI|nr:hypothetical protein O1611_g1808 [Lasiodiplodia mahajangana]